MTAEEQPQIKVRGKRQSQIKEKQEKVNRSAFLYTISTNQRYDDSDPNLAADEEIFEDVIKDILHSLPQYVQVKEAGKKWDSSSIKDVDVEYTVERGKTGQLHAHIVFRIKHNTKIHLAYGAIKEKVCSELGLNNVYTNNVLLGRGAWEADWLREYLNKARYP